MEFMDLDKLEKKILEYGTQKEMSNLQNMLSKCSEGVLKSLVNRLLNNSTFPKIWDLLLKALRDSPKCQEKRMNVILAVLNELEERGCMSSSLSSRLVERLCMDLLNLNTADLVNICNFCLNSIQSTKSLGSFSWKDLLPELLRILSEKDMVEFNDLEYTGLEFKNVLITTLCMNNWSANKIIQLAAMFSDMSLTKDEHLKVVIKLSSYIGKLTPQEVPPFVYQLFRLCRHYNSRVVFLELQHYFGWKIYSNANLVQNNTLNNSPDLDLIESAEDHEALEAESMVLFHIQSSAENGHNCIKDYLNLLKNTERSPDFILHPFQLLALFTISTAAQYKETAFDIIRHSIVRCYNEHIKRTSSYWYRDVLPAQVMPEEIFAQIINLGDREFLLEAFANFGFVLLSVGSALGRDVIAEKQWTLGTIILLKIIKKKRNVTSVLLKTFCNDILDRQSVTQYIECLYFLSKTSPLLMLENQSCTVELVESLIQIPSHIAIQLIDALMPLTKISHTIRDQLLLILRKSLYSRSTEMQQVAVYGYVKLITTLDISGNGTLSQNSIGSFSSGHSLYSQISLSRTSQSPSLSVFSSEAICWEVLGILKRCFMQQAEVKLQLYDDLRNAVCVNPGLAVPTLDILWFHLMEYYVIDDETNPPLNVSNISILKDTESVHQEPLGKFIYSISQIVAKAHNSEDDKESPTVKKYIDVLNSLCRRMSNCELVHFDLDDGTDLTDLLPESQQKLQVLEEIISVFEALIGYKIAMLSSGSENQCGIINSLLQGYSRFLQFGKNISKPKKAKKLDKTSKENKSTQKLQTQANTTRKIETGAKGVAKVFKCPDTVLDLSIAEKGLKTLLESKVNWASSQDVNSIRTKTDLHRHFVQATLSLLVKCKNFKPVDNTYQKNEFYYVTSIAETLYNRVILRLSDYVDFDCTSAVCSIECFHAVLVLINSHYKGNLINFLSKVGGREKTNTLIDHLKPMIEVFEKLFETDEVELSADPEIKRLHLAVLNSLHTLCNFIPIESNELAVQVYEWSKQIAYNNTISVKVAGHFMSLICDLHIRYKPEFTLFDHVSRSFFDIFGPVKDDDSVLEETDETLKIVNVGTANSIILAICSYNKSILEDVESVIGGIKSDYYILTYPNESDTTKKEKLKSKEKGVTCHLCSVSKILTNLIKLALPPGNLSNAVLKNVVQFYSTLSSLTKYFISRASKNSDDFQGGWFERLVKLTGKRLASAIYDFLYHLEADQKEDEQTQKMKKIAEGSALKCRILKDTKIIPKVIYEMEQFSKYIMQLSNKTKHDFSKYIGQGTTRDFRINLQNVQNDLMKATEGTTMQESEDDSNSDGETQDSGPSPVKRVRK